MISPSQRPLPDNTQQTNIHAPGGIRTHNLSRRAAKDLRLRPRGHWDRRYVLWISKLNDSCDIMHVKSNDNFTYCSHCISVLVRIRTVSCPDKVVNLCLQVVSCHWLEPALCQDIQTASCITYRMTVRGRIVLPVSNRWQFKQRMFAPYFANSLQDSGSSAASQSWSISSLPFSFGVELCVERRRGVTDGISS